MKIALILGARPQIIKSAPIIHEALKHSEIDLRIIHTGQHYDYKMSKLFFDELGLPDASVNLGVGSGYHGWQTGIMLLKIEKALIEHKPDFVLVPGDTNSTLAGALAATKLNVPVAHIEAGARSYDMGMPEEVNRRLTDHCSSLLFTVSKNCTDNLLKEGIEKKQILQAGDTMYDAFLQHSPRAMKSDVLERLGLRRSSYVVLAVHRPSNVDNLATLKNILDAVSQLDKTTIFPAHPRTKERLLQSGLIKNREKKENIKLLNPLSYHEMLKLVADARLILTDSGGLQKEAFWLQTSCITLRDRTEWIETTRLGANTLVGNEKERIVKEARKKLATVRKARKISNPFGDGTASTTIVKKLMKK